MTKKSISFLNSSKVRCDMKTNQVVIDKELKVIEIQNLIIKKQKKNYIIFL